MQHLTSTDAHTPASSHKIEANDDFTPLQENLLEEAGKINRHTTERHNRDTVDMNLVPNSHPIRGNTVVARKDSSQYESIQDERFDHKLIQKEQIRRTEAITAVLGKGIIPMSL